MKKISAITEYLGLDPKTIIPYGHYMAKIPIQEIPRNDPRGKLVIVTAITPTPSGEGKTTVSIGLTQGLSKLGHRAVVTLRQPSLGPVFGIKGGGTGGGLAKVVPEEEINLHFTGDMHAVASAHNLLAALVDNTVYRGTIEGFNPEGIEWRRVTDASDRGLRQIVTGLGDSSNGLISQSGFDIVAASEIMAILALASDLEDLRRRLNNITVGVTRQGTSVTVKDLNVVGALMALLRHAIKPNVVQTTEGQPALIHTGPFGNIAHGCSSVLGDKLAMSCADYVVTEAGFGADLGFEKFMHIKTRVSGLLPRAAVLVATVRALKWHAGVAIKDLGFPNEKAIKQGAANLQHMVQLVQLFGIPVVVAVNRFPNDIDTEISLVKNIAMSAGAQAAAAITAFQKGGAGALELAQAVTDASSHKPSVSYIYHMDSSIEEKVTALAQKVYGASGVEWSAVARNKLKRFESMGLDQLPICMAKTHLSISHNPRLKGRPSGFAFQIADMRVATGAGYVYPLAGKIMTLPGLPSKPRALDLDTDSHGDIMGLA